MADQLCSDCRYWEKHIHMGVCKRYPSICNKSSTDWCGEWQGNPVVIYEAPAVEVQQAEPVKKKLGRPRKEAS